MASQTNNSLSSVKLCMLFFLQILPCVLYTGAIFKQTNNKKISHVSFPDMFGLVARVSRHVITPPVNIISCNQLQPSKYLHILGHAFTVFMKLCNTVFLTVSSQIKSKIFVIHKRVFLARILNTLYIKFFNQYSLTQYFLFCSVFVS